MSFVKYHNGIEVGTYVQILIGPHKGRIARVISIEVDSGARNGWVTVNFDNKDHAMYAGEELKSVVVPVG